MFGNLGQLMQLMKNAGQIKEQMQAINARLEAARFMGQAGGGQVNCTVNGRGEVVTIKFEPALLQGGDTELIEDLTVAAVRDAVTRSREGMQKEMQALTGGLNVPGLENLFGG